MDGFYNLLGNEGLGIIHTLLAESFHSSSGGHLVIKLETLKRTQHRPMLLQLLLIHEGSDCTGSGEPLYPFGNGGNSTL